MDLDLQGRIERFTLPEILQLIASSRKSGTLGIQKDDTIVMLYFKDGNIIYGYGPRQTFHLGQLLKERGIITAQQLDEAVQIQSKTDNSKRLGEILMSRNSIDRADLESVVRKQVEELSYSLLSWETGSFKFYEDQYPTQEEITVQLSVENVVMEGLRRYDEMNMVRETLPDLNAVYIISASQAGRRREVALESHEWNVMALVDGYRTIEEVCKYSSLDKLETLKSLARLKLAGIITKRDRKPEPKDTLSESVNRLAGLFEEYLTQKQRPAADRSRLTTTLLEATE
jgi:hypothetical protein